MSSTPDAAPQAAAQAPPVDFVTRQLTLRALGTGMILGGVLSICNVYTGLKIGWGLNMSITGILLAYVLWLAISRASSGRVSMMNRLENNVNQSACSAAGAVSSAGLVSAIPAVTMLEGTTFPWWQLSLWLSVVCLVGIVVAMGLRRQMIVRDKLPFPGGLACAETLKEIYSTGAEAVKRVGVLGIGAAVACGLKILNILKLTKASDFGLLINGAPASKYLLTLDPTLLMVAVGGLVGLRSCISLLGGAILAYAVLGPWLVNTGRAALDKAQAAAHNASLPPEQHIAPFGEWLLWPGVTLMVVSSLVSFGFSMPAILRSFRRTSGDAPADDAGEVSRKWFFGSIVVVLLICVALQTWFFGISWWAAIFAVLLSFILAIVATRVAGETNVTPVGAMGKVTQLLFAVMLPKNASANLMGASITAGAASQCADLMHDLKCGYLLGAVARYQVIAQIGGAVAGALVGSAFYLILVPNPTEMLLTPEWPAPAVAMWKAVAEVFQRGLGSLPEGAPMAMLIAAIAGIIFPVAEKTLPKKAALYVPSSAAAGLAFVISGTNSISMFIGAVIGAVLAKLFPNWSTRFFVTLCAGIIAGESLTGAGDAIRLVLQEANK
ncbi:MAG: OPT family oligopeptide transporter [Planctomycetota bacterium]|nr:OPT family oligopeptide transporter [Planctomycetota bacterium]